MPARSPLPNPLNSSASKAPQAMGPKLVRGISRGTVLWAGARFSAFFHGASAKGSALPAWNEGHCVNTPAICCTDPIFGPLVVNRGARNRHWPAGTDLRYRLPMCCILVASRNFLVPAVKYRPAGWLPSLDLITSRFMSRRRSFSPVTGALRQKALGKSTKICLLPRPYLVKSDLTSASMMHMCDGLRRLVRLQQTCTQLLFPSTPARDTTCLHLKGRFYG
jgi:hypothetical protein